MLWPYIVAKQTKKYYRLVTGKEMSGPRALLLKKELARLTRDVRNN